MILQDIQINQIQYLEKSVHDGSLQLSRSSSKLLL